MSPPPSPRRFATWAAFLVLPLVLGAVAYPWLARRLGGGGGRDPAVARASAAARAAEEASAASVRRADEALGLPGATTLPGGPGTGGAAPPHPAAPTAAQREASRQADLAAARAEQQGWQRVETMAPREAQRDAAGELVAPFQGFGLSVESTPPGATVRVAGRDVGETPLVTSVECRPGEAVEVRVERRPLRPQVRRVRCRADALLTVQVSLAR